MSLPTNAALRMFGATGRLDAIEFHHVLSSVLERPGRHATAPSLATIN